MQQEWVSDVFYFVAYFFPGNRSFVETYKRFFSPFDSIGLCGQQWYRVNVSAWGWSSWNILESWIFVNKVAAMYPVILDCQEQMHKFDDFQVSFIRRHLNREARNLVGECLSFFCSILL
jgi:hypothetical protein